MLNRLVACVNLPQSGLLSSNLVVFYGATRCRRTISNVVLAIRNSLTMLAKNVVRPQEGRLNGKATIRLLR
jgi:hypothetical protein